MGNGHARREFLHVDDLADACLFLLERELPRETDLLNIGTGVDVTIAELAALIGDIVGYTGDLVFDTSRPDGTPRKLMDVRRMHALGWDARISLEAGLRSTYAWYREQTGAPPAVTAS